MIELPGRRGRSRLQVQVRVRPACRPTTTSTPSRVGGPGHSSFHRFRTARRRTRPPSPRRTARAWVGSLTGPVITIIEPASESVTVIPEAPGPAPASPTEARRTRTRHSVSHDPADHHDPRSETPEDSAPGHPSRRNPMIGSTIVTTSDRTRTVTVGRPARRLG
jgi:hypothetical protein